MKILNAKNREFCEEYVSNGYKGSLAYSKVYNQEDSKAAAVGASQLLKQQKIRDYIDLVEGNFKILGQREGVDKTTLVKVLKEMLSATKKDIKGETVPDWQARNNAIATFAKLAGLDAAKDPSGGLMDEDNDEEIAKLGEKTEEEKKLYREELLKNL